MDYILKPISKCILTVFNTGKIQVERILLFGSRAKGTQNRNSDFDILVITSDNLGRTQKSAIAKKIRIGLAKIYLKHKILSGTDIIIRSISESDEFRSRGDTVTAQALNEGKTIWPLKM